ncbi:hypothetical protein ACIRRA_15140 [Nocardia sp. NPDC101769]|uniref:hypothetical protein n=1 Tax=Nocardia sp. NPDC101769 TaxID=3364333 RepID=UPI003824974B
MISAITTDNYNDLGASLLMVRDPARELRDRADTWILQHFPTNETASEQSFRALTNLPYTSEFRPIPDYPGRDEQLADFADELRQRAEKLRRRVEQTRPRQLTVQTPEIKNPPPIAQQPTVTHRPTPPTSSPPKPTSRRPHRVPPATRGRPRRRGL